MALSVNSRHITTTGRNEVEPKTWEIVLVSYVITEQ